MGVTIKVYSDDTTDNHELECFHVVHIIRNDNADSIKMHCDGRCGHYTVIQRLLEFLGVSIDAVEYLTLDECPDDVRRIV